MTEISGLGKKSREQLGKILRQTQGTLTVQEAASILQRPSKETAKLLARWATQGWLSRVRRGMYIPVPLEAASTDGWVEDPWILAERLYHPCYIGGWSAAEYWDLTEQIFRSILVITTRSIRQRTPVVQRIPFYLRTIAENHCFGTRPVWRGQIKIQVSDPTKTILDMLSVPRLGGGIRPVTDMLLAYLRSENGDPDQLIFYAEQLGNGAVFKRLGYLAETFLPDQSGLTDACRKRLTHGKALLDPDLSADRLVTSWRLWIPAHWAEGGGFDS